MQNFKPGTYSTLKAKNMLLKSVLITSVILLSYLVFFGQTGFPYDQEWKRIDSLMNKKNLPKSALVEVNKVYAVAKKDKQEAQWVKAIIYKNHLRESNDQNFNYEIKELENEIVSAPPRVAVVLKSQNTIDQMKYWLLQQKRNSHWPNTKATADACYALLLNGSDWLASQQTVSIQLGNYKINSNEEKTEAGTGYFKKQIPGDEVLPGMGNIQVSLSRKSDSTINHQPSTVNGQRSMANPSWGAIYWQYFENLDKITTAQTQLSISKNLFIEKNSDKGPVLEAVSERNILKPGDKLKMRIIIKTDRDLEYVHLKDMRAACLEPVNVLSGYEWQGGLGYYQTTKDASTSFFFDRLLKGTFVFEYPVFVTTSGNYGSGISILECMYAPEFAAHSEGIRLHVESK
jgi:hypothetical protein